jgi:ribosomal protein S18 acetylase RimI-like enzyme
MDGNGATIDTIATHPDHQGKGVATALLRTALPVLKNLGIATLDAWTREDAPTKGWYLRNGFFEIYRYMHVYLGADDDPNGFATPEALSLPIVGFMHGLIEHETELRSRFKRTYVCRQYLLPVRTQ